jgi:hypothetical protein
LASFSKQPWAVKWLILGRFKFLIGCFNLWLPPELLGFIFIISDPIRVISIRFFFNLWSNGGAQWTREVENFQREESEQWTSVHHRRNKRRLSYADAVHHQGFLSSPIRVPIGVKQVQPDRSVRGQLSFFDRIIWPKDGDRSRQGRSWHHFWSQFLNHGRNQKLGAAMNKGNTRRLERSRQSQFPNFQAKGKQLMDQELSQPDSWPCIICASSGLSNVVCKSWVVCLKCHKRGHVAIHCSAR